MHVTAIIAAGGRGLRLGGAQPKQLMTIGGRPILQRSVYAFLEAPAVDEVIVALPQHIVGDPPEYLRSIDGVTPKTTLKLVAGGERRQDSVANAFRAADPSSDVIVIHDAARPFASPDLIARTIAAAAESGAALAALQSRDTVKRVAGPPQAGPHKDVASAFRRTVLETIPRETIYLAQTPQAFRRDVLAAALELHGDATDEATLVERAGHAVRLVEAEATNIKITTMADLELAEAIADCGLRIAEPNGPGEPNRQSQSQSQSAIRNPQSATPSPALTGRAGTGYDLHRLVEGRPLVIGGITIPSDRGALGHSDADVVCHAVTDAVLGAACLGDIGRHFPDSDSAWKDASSVDLLGRAVAMAAEQGLMVGNVDVTVILERPKIKDHVDAMRAVLARALGVEIDRVSVKGKTNEGVDALGRGEAIAAHAVALLRAR